MIYQVSPILKSYIWGGDKLQKIFHNDIQNLAEAWVLSAVENESSKIVGSDETILSIFNKNNDIVSKNYTGKFPLLVKVLCSSRDLSVQNHPAGKAEFWHILDAEKDSYIYLGLSHSMSKEELKQSLKNSTICEHLNKIYVKKGDCFFIPPGVIHMLGKGILTLEIQQNLNLTYRLFDFNRVDVNGKLRELKIDEGVEVSDLNKFEIKNQNVSLGSLVKCPFFSANRCHGHHEDIVDEYSFAYIYILSGQGSLASVDGVVPVTCGDSLFVCSGHGKIILDGDIEFVVVKK